MDDSLETVLDLQSPWEQRTRETKFEYAWFVRYAELGPERTLERAARQCGVPIKGVREAARANDWEARAKAFDAAVIEIQKAVIPDESEALAIQYQAGTEMLKLGLRAIQVKNPALIRVKDIAMLLKEGAEMVRRGAGVADLKIKHDVVQRVAEDLELILGPDVFMQPMQPILPNAPEE